MLDEVKWNSSTNNLKIQNSYIELDNDIRQVEKNIAGGYVKIDKTQSFNGIVTANNNRVDIINSYVDAGGENQKINGGYVSEISDNFTGFTSADNNIVNIDNSSVFGSVVAGENVKGQANGNYIIIKNNSYVITPEGEEIIGGFGKMQVIILLN